MLFRPEQPEDDRYSSKPIYAGDKSPIHLSEIFTYALSSGKLGNCYEKPYILQIPIKEIDKNVY